MLLLDVTSCEKVAEKRATRPTQQILSREPASIKYLTGIRGNKIQKKTLRSPLLLKRILRRMMAAIRSLATG
jgi:hypothetical protein